MQRLRLSPVEFYEREVFPHLTPEIVYSGIPFRSTRGRYWRGPCPLHGGDNHTAFSVDTITLGWTCFSHCGGGSVLGFVNGGQTPRGEAFLDAVRKLADLAGVDPARLDRTWTDEEADQFRAEERKRLLLERFAAFARDALLSPAGEAARAYLTGPRGIPEDALDLLDVGFYPSAAAVRAELSAGGYSTDELEASGLLADGRWSGRLVIPWRDHRGHIATFAARDLSGATDPDAKYLYMRGGVKPPAFGLDIALRHNPSRRNLVLVEGLMDVLAFHAHGHGEVCALGGNGRLLTPERWDALAALGFRQITLMLDNDAAGREGTLAAVQNVDLTRNVPLVYLVDPAYLTPYKDPDELLRASGVPAISDLLSNRTPAAIFLAEEHLAGIAPDSADAEKEEALREVFAILADLRSDFAAIYRSRIEASAALHTGYDVASIRADADRQIGGLSERRAEAELERSLRRALAARASGADLRTALAEHSETLARVLAPRESPPPLFSVDRLLVASRETPVGLDSGWSPLDALEVRFASGELSVIGARTGHCKTSVLVGLLANWLWTAEERRTDQRFLFYSMEEPELAVFHRLLALLTTRYPSPGAAPWTVSEVRDWLRDRTLRESYRGAPRDLQTALDRLRAWEGRIGVIYRPGWTSADIAAHARQSAREHAVSGVVVDYLQRVSPPAGSFDRRDIEISAVTRQFKALAVDLDAPVVAAAQIGRQAVEDSRKLPPGDYFDPRVQDALRLRRPQLHHLREGGSEQEADLVLGLLNYRADYQEDLSDAAASSPIPNVTRLEVGTLKNRYGTPGRWVSLAFDGRYGLLRNPFLNELDNPADERG
jgi:DNA primase catalytic core